MIEGKPRESLVQYEAATEVRFPNNQINTLFLQVKPSRYGYQKRIREFYQLNDSLKKTLILKLL